jgi:hypothetical protein
MALTDVAVKTAKPREKAYRLYDTGGLYLEVSPAGSKLWRVKYRFDGKEKRLSLGAYPELGLQRQRAHTGLRKGRAVLEPMMSGGCQCSVRAGSGLVVPLPCGRCGSPVDTVGPLPVTGGDREGSESL